jgi:two-component system sensor histidine kinase HupT/HoxJ
MTAKKLAELAPLGEVGEQVWIDVIHKMDEVYSDLLRYEVALEENNAALERSQQFILSVLTSMSDVLVVCDRDGVVQEVNQAMVKLTGLSEQALRGSSLLDLFADEASRSKAAQYANRLEDAVLHDCEMQIRTSGEGSVPVALNCTPRFNAQGRPEGLVLTGRPVGELRQAYSALHQAHEELKRTQQQLLHSEKMASLGLLVAGVAHELNNPISFVLGNVHALKRYAERIKTYLDALHAGATETDLGRLREELRMEHMLNDLEPLIEGTIEGAERTRDIVDALKRFSVRDTNERAIFNLAEILERSVHWVVKAAAPEMQVQIDIPRVIEVSGSAGQMQQVIVNLVQNAVDAASRQPQARLRILAHVADGFVDLAFHDNGPGIEDKFLEHVFDPFFTTKPVGKGTGLGLSISYGIVERHGGTLSVSNHPHGGAEFRLRLPLARR